MKVKYVGGSAAVEVGDLTVQRNHQVEVDDKLAGRPPDPRLAVAMVELREAVEAADHYRAVELRDEISKLDYGEGLLAQDIWQVVESKASKKEDDK